MLLIARMDDPGISRVPFRFREGRKEFLGGDDECRFRMVDDVTELLSPEGRIDGYHDGPDLVQAKPD